MYIYMYHMHIFIYIYIKHITLVLNVSAVPAWNIFWLSFVELIEIWNQDTSSCAANGDDTICCLLTDPVEAFQCQDQCNTFVRSCSRCFVAALNLKTYSRRFATATARTVSYIEWEWTVHTVNDVSHCSLLLPLFSSIAVALRQEPLCGRHGLNDVVLTPSRPLVTANDVGHWDQKHPKVLIVGKKKTRRIW